MFSKIFAGFLLVTCGLLIGHTAHATNMCDAGCSLTANFTDGGSIVATQALDIHFGAGGILMLGTGGTINVAVQPANTDYSSGGTLSLGVGESITVGSGGVLDLGSAGNIDYTNMDLIIDGDLSVKALGGSQTVSLHGGLLSVTASVELVSDVTNSGTLSFSTSTVTSGAGSVTNLASGEISLIGGSVVSGGAGVFTITELNTNILTVSGAATLTPVNGTLTVGVLQVTSLTPELLVTLEGALLATEDDEGCTVTGGECISSSGAKYVVNADGDLVQAVEAGSSLDIYLPGLFAWMMLLLRQRRCLFIR